MRGACRSQLGLPGKQWSPWRSKRKSPRARRASRLYARISWMFGDETTKSFGCRSSASHRPWSRPLSSLMITSSCAAGNAACSRVVSCRALDPSPKVCTIALTSGWSVCPEPLQTATLRLGFHSERRGCRSSWVARRASRSARSRNARSTCSRRSSSLVLAPISATANMACASVRRAAGCWPNFGRKTTGHERLTSYNYRPACPMSALLCVCAPCSCSYGGRSRPGVCRALPPPTPPRAQRCGGACQGPKRAA